MSKIKDIKQLYLKAKNHFFHFNFITQETEKTEAFLLQCTLLEGVLYDIALNILHTKYKILFNKKKGRYSLDYIINDLFLLNIISKKEFDILENFKHDRNKYFHNIIKQNIKTTEKELGEKYENYKEITWHMVEKLENLSK